MTSAAPRLVLASSSPRRIELLRALGWDARVLAPDIDEEGLDGESPAERAARLAATKARHVARGLPADEPESIVLGADTLVVLEGAVLGKPEDDADAFRMLRRLSGSAHEVFTGVHLVRTGDGREAGAVERTRVRFRAYGEDVIRWYVGSGEPAGKAGAYSIQGLGALLSEGIEGSWSNVVGLPVERLVDLFSRVGVDLLERIGRSAPERA